MFKVILEYAMHFFYINYMKKKLNLGKLESRSEVVMNVIIK